MQNKATRVKHVHKLSLSKTHDTILILLNSKYLVDFKKKTGSTFSFSLFTAVTFITYCATCTHLAHVRYYNRSLPDVAAHVLREQKGS